MKKIFSIMMLALSASFVFTSCDDDDVEYVSEQQNALPVVSRETSFSAAASQGTIVLEANGPLTVTTDAGEWITTTVDGNKVNVSVALNDSYDGRSAMLTISDGSRSAKVAVIQAGVIFDLGGVTVISHNNTTCDFSYPVNENCNPQISTDADWITAELADGALKVKVAANTTGYARHGNVIYTTGSLSDKIPVYQGDFNQNIAGDYNLYFVNADGQSKYTKVKLRKSGVNYYLDMFNRSYPIVYNDRLKTVTWLGGQYVAPYTYQNEERYIVTLVYDTVSGYLTWGQYGMAAFPEAEAVGGKTTTVLRFKDDGSWGSHTANAFRTELFTSKTSFSSSTRLSVRLGDDMINPYMVKQDATSNAPENAEEAVQTVSLTSVPAI